MRSCYLLRVNSRNFAPGDLLEAPNNLVHLHLIERIDAIGVWVEVVHREPARWNDAHGMEHITWTKNAGHGGFIRHDDDFFSRHRRVGSLPRLVGRRTLTVTVPAREATAAGGAGPGVPIA